MIRTRQKLQAKEGGDSNGQSREGQDRHHQENYQREVKDSRETEIQM